MTRNNIYFLLTTLPLLLLIPVTFIGLSVYTGSKAIEGISVPAESLYGGPIPSHVKVYSSIELRDGFLAQYKDLKSNIRVSLVQTTNEPRAYAKEQDKLLLHMLKEYATGGGLSEHVSPVIIQFAAAQFDPRRASEYSVSDAQIAEHIVKSEKFKNNREVFFEMGLLNLPDMQVLYLASDDEQPVNSEALYAFLSEMPLLNSTVAGL